MWKCKACAVEMEEEERRCKVCDTERKLAQEDELVVKRKIFTRKRVLISLSALVVVLAVLWSIFFLPQFRIERTAKQAVREHILPGNNPDSRTTVYMDIKEIDQISDKQWIVEVSSEIPMGQMTYYVLVEKPNGSYESVEVSVDRSRLIE